jgi:hypothetical protein
MTALSPTHGYNADVQIGTSGAPGTAGTITQYNNTVSFSFSRDKAEVSAFKNLFKAYVAGMADLSVPLAGPADPVITGILWNLFTMSNAGNAIILVWAPDGISGGSGTPLWTTYGFLDKYEEKGSINSAYEWTANFQSSVLPVRTIQ